MKRKETFVADDGKVFDTEDSCIYYEKTMPLKKIVPKGMTLEDFLSFLRMNNKVIADFLLNMGIICEQCGKNTIHSVSCGHGGCD